VGGGGRGGRGGRVGGATHAPPTRLRAPAMAALVGAAAGLKRLQQ
jgi:hypothetical protein